MKKTFGLLGGNLSHSFSPLIHSRLGDYAYPLYEIPPGGVDAFMREARFDGLNITIPYKQTVVPYCAGLSEEARQIGSVNTIVKMADGKLHGHNTDHHGFQALLEWGKIDPQGKKILVLGGGGSARTVRSVLSNMGAKEIVPVSRRGQNNYENIDRHFDADAIVNTTPVGMYPHNGESPLALGGFAKLSGVVDLIYNPARTKLLLDAERMDIPCVGGLIMLVAQAEAASRLFMSRPPRPLLVNDIHNMILKKTRNIALIGMPGCGKSKIGRALAEALERPFIDIDEKIEEAAGKNIPQIFAEDGEEAFRQLETRILSQEAKGSGGVIATGGGIVTRPENRDLLRQNSLIVYLARELADLGRAGRPLTQSVGLETLAEQRLPLYEAWSDCAVTVGANPQSTAALIQEAIRGAGVDGELAAQV
jgi:shikimate dehydrogenase